jgi:hypothetical protein
MMQDVATRRSFGSGLALRATLDRHPRSPPSIAILDRHPRSPSSIATLDRRRCL